MFDHLGPIPVIKTRKKRINLRPYLAALLFILAFYLVVWSTTTGPSTVAAPTAAAKLSVAVQSLDQRVVVGSHNIPLLVIILNNNVALNLQSLKITSQGIYQAEFLSNLKLYHQGLQLGQLSSLDKQGNLHFDLNSYVLPAGQHEILLSATDTQYLTAGDILNFSLSDASSLVWSDQKQSYLAQGTWPLSGGTINVVEQGSLWPYNLNQETITVLSDNIDKLADFSLAVDGEHVDLEKINLNYQGPEVNTNFYLEQAGNILAQASPQAGKIEFNLVKKLPLSINQPANFELRGNLPLGTYSFNLIEAQGKGLVSGKNINLSQNLFLNEVLAKKQSLQFSLLPIDKNLDQGWLAVSHFSVQTLGVDEAALHRLTWRLDSNLVDIKDAKVLINDQVQNLDIVLKDQQVVAKASWTEPIKLTSLNTDIKLLLQVEQFKEGSFIQTSLMGDKQAYQADNWSDNFLWSTDQQSDNAYALSDLPLTPQLVGY